MELGGFGGEDVVVANITKVFAFKSENMAFTHHVFWSFKLFLDCEVFNELAIISDLIKRVKTYCPLTLQDKVNFSHINLLLVKVAIFWRILKQTGHKTKSNLIQEICIELLPHLKKRLEGGRRYNILEQKLAHDVLLNLEGNTVEVGLAGHEHRAPIILPEVAEVGFDAVAQIHRNVLRTLIRLILYFLYQDEPLLQLAFIIVEVLIAHSLHNINKVIHEH